MNTVHIIDTHALIWFLEGSPRLGGEAKAALEDPQCRFALPIIALAEACWIVEHGRSSIRSVFDLLAAVDADQRVTVMPLDRDVLALSLTVTGVTEMHDRQIVASVLHLAKNGDPVALISKDENIRTSHLVPILW